MANDWFEFKQFRIEQRDAAFKVGTDGCLLGAWADVSNARHVLDIGTGSGLIALMVAQRTQGQQCDITAIDIDAQNVEQAATNIQSSMWNHRMLVKHAALQDFTSESSFDLLICNPPYFSSSTKGNDPRTNVARHDDRLSLDQLFSSARVLASRHASLALILPSGRWENADALAKAHGWYLQRRATLMPRPGKPVHRILAQWTRYQSGCREESWPIYTEGTQYHPEAHRLLSPFYTSL